MSSRSSTSLGRFCPPQHHRPVPPQAPAQPLARIMPTSVTWILGSLSWSDILLIISPRSQLRRRYLDPQVPVRKLYLSSEQDEAIRKIYSRKGEFRMQYGESDASQADAEKTLCTNGLSQTGQPHNRLENCWLTAWSSTWGSKKGVKKRSLFQWYVFLFSSVDSPVKQGSTVNSSSGYSTAARQARDKRGSQNPIEWSRQADYEFTGCLAHADVTWNRDSKKIERIIGYFEHSKTCEAAAVIRSALGET